MRPSPPRCGRCRSSPPSRLRWPSMHIGTGWSDAGMTFEECSTMSVKLRVMIGSGLVSALLAIGCASNPGKLSQEKPVPAIDASAGVGLQGYDAVAYFTDHKPVRGSDVYTRQWQGVTWKFGSAEH